MKTTFLPVLALALVPAAVAASNPLDVYAPLVGRCWRGEFPHGKATDEHCYTWVYDGRHLRDVHVVRGDDGGEYRGETIYSWDEKRGRIVYRYWNSDGGYSDGDIVEADGELVSREERYVGKDGSEQVFRSKLRIVGPDSYEASTESLRNGEWQEEWVMTFERIGEATDDGRTARKQASGCRTLERKL